MSSQAMAEKIIYNSAYSEFPDIIATIQLAKHFAKKDFRDDSLTMRHCARECLKRAVNKHLRRTLQEMSVSPEPNLELANLIICYTKMRDELAKELKGKTITQQDLEALKAM
jgi:hypothetical protein